MNAAELSKPCKRAAVEAEGRPQIKPSAGWVIVWPSGGHSSVFDTRQEALFAFGRWQKAVRIAIVPYADAVKAGLVGKRGKK